MSKIRIGFILPNLNLIGAQRVTATTLRLIDRTVFEPHLILLTRSGEISKELPNDIPIYVLSEASRWAGFPKIRILIWPRTLATMLRGLGLDLVVGCSPIAGVTALLQGFFGGPRIPVIAEEHQHLSTALLTDPNNFHPIFRYGYRVVVRLYARARFLRCVSQDSADDFVRWGVRRDRVVSIPPPIDFTLMSERLPHPVHPWFLDDVPIVCGFGRLSSQKDFSLLIRAFALIQSDQPCRLMIIGDGPERSQLEQLCRDLGISDRVHFTGYQTNPHDWLRRCNLFVLSSRWEGMPAVLIEAMRCGLPCVSVDCFSGPREIFRDGVDGVLCRTRQPEDLSREILSVLRNKDQSRLLAEAALKRSEAFSAVVVVRQLESLYREAIV